MGAAGYQLNKQINDTVAYKKAIRKSPSAVQGTGIGYDPREGRPTELQVSGPDGETYFQGIRAQDYGKGPTYETPEEALANYSKLLADVNKRVEQTASKYNYSNFDPADFARAGFSGPSAPAQQAAADKVSDYLIENEIPPYIEVDGQKLYFTTGFGEDALSGALGDEYKSEGSYQSFGDAGTYSTVYVEPEGLFEGMNPLLRAGLGALTGGVSEAFMTATKALSGETLKTGDYLSLAVTGLQQSGMLKAPVSEAQAAEAGTQAMNAANAAGATAEAAMAAGQAAQDLALAGQGIAGLSYADTMGLLNVAATGDPTSFIINKFGNEALDKAFADVDMDSRLLDRFQAEDVKSGMVKVVEEVAGGSSFDDALVAGLGKYIREGGGLNLDGMDIDLGVVEDIVRDAVRPIGAIATDVAHAVEEFVEPLEEKLKPIEQIAQAGGDVIEDFAQAGGDVVEDVAQFTGDVIEDVAQPIGDALSALDTAVRQNLPNISAPDIDLPSMDLDLPSIDLDLQFPNIGLDFTPSSSTMVASRGLSPTRTTDSLFGDDLFAFETEIGISPEYFEYADILDDGGLMPRTKQRRMYPFT